MVWGYESTQALPVGIPQRTFLPSHCLHCASGIASHCSSFRSHCRVGWRPGLYSHSVQGGVGHFLLDFPLLLHFCHKLSSHPCFAIPSQCNGTGLGFGKNPWTPDHVWRCNPNKFHGIKLQQGAFSEVTLKWQTLSCDTGFAGLFLGCLFFFF